MRKKLLIPIVLLALFFTSSECPAPFIYTPGEGWSYETPGSAGKWIRETAKDQLDVAKQAFDEEDYKIVNKAAGRVIRQWPFSDYAPEAQYMKALAYEGRKRYEKAFKSYQDLLTKYPKYDKYDEVLNRQFEIANRFLEGRRFRIWGLFPLYRSMDKTTEMYKDLIKSGPYSDVAPDAQMNIGAAREKKKDFAGAVVAYETAADKYSGMEGVAANALYSAGEALMKEAKEAEYDQSVARRAIDTFNDFGALHPEDTRNENAETFIRELRVEQARGNLKVARYYDKLHIDRGALTYYNEVVDIFSRLLNDTEHEFAVEARERIAQLKAELSDGTEESNESDESAADDVTEE